MSLGWDLLWSALHSRTSLLYSLYRGELLGAYQRPRHSSQSFARHPTAAPLRADLLNLRIDGLRGSGSSRGTRTRTTAPHPRPTTLLCPSSPSSSVMNSTNTAPSAPSNDPAHTACQDNGALSTACRGAEVLEDARSPAHANARPSNCRLMACGITARPCNCAAFVRRPTTKGPSLHSMSNVNAQGGV